MCVSQSGYDLFERGREREILSEEGGQNYRERREKKSVGVLGDNFTEMALSGLGVKRCVTARMGVEGKMVIGHGLKVFLQVTTWKVSKKTGHPFVRPESHFFSHSFFLVGKFRFFLPKTQVK